MIALERVSKTYQPTHDTVFHALQDISLTIKAGEFVAIMGPSGSGKSTLMHLLGLLDKPTTGVVTVRNQNIAGRSDSELSLLRQQFVGFVFQQFNLIHKLTVAENILLPTIYARTALDFDPASRCRELLGKLGLSDKADMYPNQLSGGQQQRVAIARALIMAPSLILADEPTGNLDTKTGKEILDLLVSLNRVEKLTVVLVTHDPSVAKRAKRIVRIRDGKLVRQKT